MATVSFGHVTNASSGPVLTKAISITLYANTLAVIDVLTHNSTPADLQKPTLAGTGGETWHEEITDTNGGATPGIRITRFRTMVATDTPTTVTATCTLSQTNIDMEYVWVGGVDTSGTDGSGACGASQSQNSSGSNVTSASKSLGTPAHPRNGYIATCRAPSGAMGSRSGWTEEYDSTGGGTYGQLQVQTINKPDTAWSMTCSSGTYCVLITEVIAAPSPAVIAQVQARASAAISASTATFTFVAQAARTYVLIAIGSTSITGFTPNTPGLTWELRYHPAQRSNGNEMYVYVTRVSKAGEYTVQVTGMAGTSGNGSWGTLEVACDDSVYQYGIIQEATTEHNSGGTASKSFTINPPESRDSSMLWYQCNGNTPRVSQPGWQNCPTFSNSSNGGGSFRTNADNNATMTWFTGLGVNPLQAWFAEFAGIADCTCESVGAAPVVAVISPTPGTAIGRDDELVVDVTDEDEGEFRRILPALKFHALGRTELIHDGETFQGAFTGSSRESITDGYRYTLRYTGGWPRGETMIELIPFVYDTTGNEAA